ncbi:hypothetical protein VNO80_09661 [Phaseolus coccineus]|uniref:Uncharacterized protein n=1 Tax=Phaseolus coccineus TaxID=3886 RepID=A0AAN9N8F8_PHACN
MVVFDEEALRRSTANLSGCVLKYIRTNTNSWCHFSQQKTAAFSSHYRRSRASLCFALLGGGATGDTNGGTEPHGLRLVFSHNHLFFYCSLVSPTSTSQPYIEVTYTESENGQVCFIVFGVEVKYAFIGFINGFSEIGMNVMMELGP